MKLRIISLLLISSLCVLLLASCGDSGDTGTNVTIGDLLSGGSKGLAYEVSSENPNECTITGIGTCTDKDIVVPSQIDGKRVIGIADGAFAAKSSAAPAPRAARARNLATQGDEFYSTVLPDDLFDDTSNSTAPEEIESVTLPLSVREIGEEAFLGCENLETITTTQSITSIGKDAFKDTAYFNNQENWENGALYLSSYLITVSTTYTGEFTVKEGTTIIADHAFNSCVQLTKVNLAESVTAVGNYAFYGCTSFSYITSAGGNLNYVVGEGAFDGCISYKDFIPVFPNPSPNPDEKPAEPSEPESLYDALTKEIFDAVKASRYDNYTAVTMRGADLKETYKASGVRYYFTREENGELVREMYADTDENGLVNYMKADGKWHFTTASIELSPYIPDELEFEMLQLIDDVNNVYGYYAPENPEMRIEIGIKGDKLVYLCYQTPDYQIRTDYTDFDKTVIDGYSHNDFVPGITLDHNGNPI